MTHYAAEYTHVLLAAMVCSMAAFLLCWFWHLASNELRRHGVAKTVLFIALSIPLAIRSVEKDGGDRGGGAGSGGQGVPGGNAGVVRSLEPGDASAATNLAFTAFAKTPSNIAFSASFPASLLPYGSRIELHEKTLSLTNSYAPIVAYVVGVGQTNLADVVSQTNGHPFTAFYGLFGDALAVSFPSLPSVVRASTGRKLFVAVSPDELDVAVTRSERPDKFPPYDPAFAADPFANTQGLAYDPTNATVVADGPGTFTLPTGDELLVLSPTLTFGTPHDYAGETLAYDEISDTYSVRSVYPLDEPCLWEGWLEGTNTQWGCTCVPELLLGADLSETPEVTNSVEVVDGVAVAKVFLNGTLVWSNACAHARYWPFGGRSDALSNDGCSSCGSCSEGSCDAFDGPSVGSVRFRVSLGSPSDGKVSGFLWFARDDVFHPAPSSFALLARPDAQVADTAANGVRTVVCSDRGGRTLVVSPVDGGVQIVSTFTASGESNRTWRITQENGAMRFRKYSAGGNLMSDVSYSRAEGVWSARDNISGRVETTASSGDVLSWDNGFSRTVETVAVCGSVTGRHVRVVSELVGCGDDAVVRETERHEKRAGGSWTTSYASYWDDGSTRRHGQPRRVRGSDRDWSWTDYDDLGRETFRLEQRNGSNAPEDAWWYSLEDLPGCDAFATVCDYTPHPGDSCSADDWERPRTISRYAVANGAATLIARTWTRYVRGVAVNGWPTVTETTIRACHRDAQIADTNNAVSIVTRYSTDSPLVPYLLRGETVSEIDEDGVATTNEFSVSGGVLSCSSRKFYQFHPCPIYSYTERDLAYGMMRCESTRLSADPSVAFGGRHHLYDSRNRLRFTQYDDGSSETNAYSCCRLLARTDRTGAKTRFCATTGTESLYNAEEEVYLAQLPRGGDYAYDTTGFTSFQNSFRSTRRWFDAFGNETNTVVRHEKTEGVSTNMYPDAEHYYATTATASRPEGLPGRSESTNARGLRTVFRAFESQAASISVSEEFLPGTTEPDVVTTNILYRGGGNAAIHVANGLAVTRGNLTEYAADGTRRDFSIVESDDNGVVTNSVTTFDFLGRAQLVETPTSILSNVYDGASSRVRVAHDLVSGAATTNLYDETGELAGAISRGVTSRSRTDYVQDGGEWWRVDSQANSAGNVTNSASASWTQLTGLSDALRSRTRRFLDGVLVESSQSSFNPETLDLTETVVSATEGTCVRKSRFGRTLEETTPAGTIWSYYDFFGWPFYEKRAQPGGTALKWRISLATPYGDLGDDGTFADSAYSHVRWRHYGYDARGNRIAETNELGEAVSRAFDAEERVVSEDGATYPLQFGYDSSGRRTSLSTTRDGVNFDVTSWGYDAATGLCTNKVYADGTSETYTHTVDALPLRTVRPDGSWTENVYDANRRRVGGTSSDSSCAYGLSMDAFGRIVAASNFVARYGYALANCGVATNETATVGFESLSVLRTVDAYGRIVASGHDGVVDEIYYNPTNGTIAAISNAEACVTYAYTSDLLDAGYVLTLADGTRFIREAHRTNLHFRNVVHAVTNASLSATNSLVYTYDNLNRPVSRNADAFAYNPRSEVSAATVSGFSATYAYDGIGNSTTSIWNGAATTRSANALNQYTAISSGGTSQTPEYSENGELARLGSREFRYDAKSRLVSVSDWRWDPSTDGYVYGVVVSNRYDHLDRRVQKITPEAMHTFFYDGWMPIKEIVANANGMTDVIEYHWGKDLSGTLGGAGGVGGLLYLTIYNSSTPNSSTHQLYVPFYDNNGNVMGYWDAQGNVVATYTYDAFGKQIASSGPMADAFSHRYSTKYFDPETGLYYYGYRFYSPDLMRWITMDPIGEEGGENLYTICKNNLLSDYDSDGYKPASQAKTERAWVLFGQVNEIHTWNCSEWPTLTDGSACGTQAKYAAHFQKVTFGESIKVPQQYIMLFSYGIVSALEMNKDTKSAWCLSLVPIEVWRRKRQNGGFDYKVSITVTNFDKHPTLKDKPEIPIKKFIGKTVEYNPYGN